MGPFIESSGMLIREVIRETSVSFGRWKRSAETDVSANGTDLRSRISAIYYQKGSEVNSGTDS